MTPPEFATAVLPILLAALGTYLLFKEVGAGHRSEELTRSLDDIRELQDVYPLNPREYLIRNWMYGHNTDRATATARVDINSPVEVQEFADDAYAAMDAQAAAKLEEWRSNGLPSVMEWRRRVLKAGFVALIASFAIDAVVDIAKFVGG